MKTRPNDRAKLFNPFNTSDFTEIDSIPIKWPHNSERIDDASWLRNEEKKLVPFVGRTIRSSHFNQMADSVVSIQHFLKENAGSVFTINDGLAELCSTANTGSSYTGVSSVSVFTDGSTLMAFAEIEHTGVSVGSSTVSAVTASGYISIPSVFGSSPYTNRSFNAIVSVEVSGASDKGWWESRSADDAISRMKQEFLCFASTVPGSSNTTLRYNVVMPKLVAFSPAGSSATLTEYPWTITKDLSEKSFNTDSSSVLRSIGRLDRNPAFYFWYNASASSTGTAYPTGSFTNNTTAVPSSLNLLECKGRFLSGLNPVLLDNTTYAGGLLWHKDLENVFVLDTGISFTWHAWGIPNGWWWVYNVPQANLAGPALRVCKEATSKSVSGYTSGIQYRGYALKFFGYPTTATLSQTEFDETIGVYHKSNIYAGSVAIVKFRYEDFGYDNGLWDQVYTNSSNGARAIGRGGFWGSLVTGTTSDGWFSSSTRPGEYQVLASTITNYTSGTGSYPPVLQLDEDKSHWYYVGYHIWKFEMVGDTLYLKRSTDGSSWTTVLEYTDPDPIEPSTTGVTGTYYLPSAFYNKPYTGSEMSDSDMIFSNITSYKITETETTENPDSTINLKVKVLMSMVDQDNSNFPLTSI